MEYFLAVAMTTVMPETHCEDQQRLFMFFSAETASLGVGGFVLASKKNINKPPIYRDNSINFASILRT